MDGRIVPKAALDYAVISCGNGIWGQLGHGSQSNDRTLRVIGGLHRKKVVLVAAGFHHSVALTGRIIITNHHILSFIIISFFSILIIILRFH